MTVEAPSDKLMMRIGSKLQLMNTCRDALWKAIGEYADVYATNVEHGIYDGTKSTRAAKENIQKAIKDLEDASSR